VTTPVQSGSSIADALGANSPASGLTLGAPSAKVNDSSTVYLGTTPAQGQPRQGHTHENSDDMGPYVPAQDKTTTLAEAKLGYYQMSRQDQLNFQLAAQLAGIVTSTHPTEAEFATAFASLANEAASYYAVGNKVTPMDVLSMDLADRGLKIDDNGKITKADGSPLGQAVDRTQSVNTTEFTDPGTAFMILHNNMQAMLGRDPTPQEIQQYLSALHSYEASHPNITSTTIGTTPNGVAVDANGNVVDTSGQTDTVKSQSVSEGTSRPFGATSPTGDMVARNQIMQTPEYGAYQAATTYMSALMAAIKGPVADPSTLANPSSGVG
jgi:hypothetical protein